jgi:hypothetical protein
MKRILFCILILLVGCASAYTIDLNITGSMNSPYPMLFVDCGRSCSQWNITHTARNYTSYFFQIEGQDILFYELSGLPSSSTEALSVRIEVTQAEGMVYQEFPLNEPYVDYPASTTYSIGFDIPIEQSLYQQPQKQEHLDLATLHQTVSEILKLIVVVL